MFLVVICWVSNCKNIVLFSKQLQASYTDVKHWEELVDFITTNGGPKEPYILILMFKCTSEENKLDEEYLALYTHVLMIIDLI